MCKIYGEITGKNFEEAKNQLKQVICEEFKRFNFLELSDNLSDREKESYKYLCKMKDEYLFHLSVQRITELLSKHFNQNVIVLIDDFDTPLEYAYKNDYYKEMSYLINMISQAAFRENDALEFALLTGCLREAKDSYFTEVYYSVYSIFDTLFDNQFGFTDEELQQMLMTYGMEDKYDEIKDWHGNYHFGNKSLFCPRDVIKHLNNLKIKNNSKPINYCVNNHLKAFEIMVKNRTTRYEIDALIKDKAFIKYIKPFLSWDESDKNFNNCWNTLVAKGYLTFIDEEYSSFYELVAPNKMAKEVLKVEVKELFDKYQEN